MRVTHTAKIPLTHDVTWGEIVRAANDAGVPVSATPSVYQSPGDRPFEEGTTELHFSWTTGEDQ